MIKVNLLRNSGLVNAGAGAPVFAGANVSVADSETKKRALLRGVAMLLLPLALYAYERESLREPGDEYETVQKNLKKLQVEKTKFGDITPRVDKYTKEKKVIDRQMDVIRELAGSRLRAVKTLDALQTLVPDRAWLKKITLDGNQVRVEGYSANEEVITQIMRSMESSAYFSKVEPRSMNQETLSTGRAIRFELESRVGKSD